MVSDFLKKFVAKNQKYVNILLAIFALVIAIYFFLVTIENSTLSRLGYLGVFFGNLIANATIIIPAFHMFITFAAGAKLNPWLVAVFAAAGTTVGELTGYFFGLGTSEVLENSKWYKKVSSWMSKNGWLTIFLLALIPNMLFDIAGIIAGSTQFKFRRFVTATFLGKLGRSFLVAYAGYFFSG
jgi:membrane protein YqaA with SNARE-associated domain